MESVRPATRGDIASLAELWDAADAEIGVQRGGERLVGTMTRPGELIGGADALGGGAPLSEDPSRLVLVGCIDEVTVGFAYATVDRRPVKPVAIVEVIYVEREARGIGVGEALADGVLAWARQRGCVGVDAFALPGNRAAKAFFEGAGFVTRLLTMHRALRDEGGHGG